MRHAPADGSGGRRRRRGKLRVKASGGIRSARTLISMLEAGANRIGTSSGANIVENWDETKTVNIKY